ncbi:MAG: hypothetical protein APR63_05840 [Desulfuromonas sp. SDB]|nr:MAG: hypothetical protein APR63_05840 [Desulfuromonas sp. SDB]
MKKIIFALITISLLFVFISGCSSSGSSFNTYLPKPNLQYNLLTQEGEWSLTKGCYWTAEFQVYNSGDAAAKNVYAHVQLIKDGNEAIRDSQNIYVGNLNPGESSTICVELDRDCDEKVSYKVTLTHG